MKNTQYDDSILQSFADDLYSRAAWVVVKTIVLYFIVSFALVFLALDLLQNQVKPPVASDTILGWSVFVAIFGALAGWSAGSAKAFQLRLQAQQILCQKQIEVNTRGTPTATSAHA